MSKRCIVPGCPSAKEETDFRNFRARVERDDDNSCPVHRQSSTACDCSKSTKYRYGYYGFPKSPGLRNVWRSLLRLPGEFETSASFVCSRHFDVGGRQKRKVPIKDIGLENAEIQRILANRISSVVEQQQIRRSTEIGCVTLRLMANATVSAILAAEDSERSQVPLHRDRGVLASSLKEQISVSIREIQRSEILKTPPKKSSATSIDGLTDNMLDISIDDDVSEPVAISSTSASASKRRSTTIDYTPPTTSAFSSKRLCNIPLSSSATSSRQAFASKENRRPLGLQNDGNNQTPKMTRDIGIDSSFPPSLCDAAISVNIDWFMIAVGNMPEKTFGILFGVRRAQFDLLFAVLEPLARGAAYWKGPKLTKIRKKKPTSSEKKPSELYKKEFLLFLMRLRHGLHVEVLSLIFGYSIGYVSMIFNTWLDLFSGWFDWLLNMPDQRTAWSLLPRDVAVKFPKLRLIIDCFELFIQSPQSTSDQSATYSMYKKGNTIKVLVAVLGNGGICFLSDSWAGRTSDDYIFKHCGISETLDSGDQVLADRGFRINDDLLRRGVELNIPPAGTGIEQFLSEDVFSTKRIANVRIRVENVIGRMKNYGIISNVMPITVLPVADKIVASVAILVNLQDRIAK